MILDPDGIDLDWYALDRDGHIGHFASSGSRVIHPRVLTSEEEWRLLNEAMLELPSLGEAQLVFRAPGLLDFWLEMAGKGMYSHDFVSWDTNYFERGHYRQIASPSRPLRLEEVPETLRKILASVVIPDVCFQRAQNVTRSHLGLAELE